MTNDESFPSASVRHGEEQKNRLGSAQSKASQSGRLLLHSVGFEEQGGPSRWRGAP